MNLLVRRRVLWDYLAGALWVLLTISVLVFLAAGALLSRVSISGHSPLAFQGSADDAGNVLIVVSTTMITVTGLVFALTIVALQIASGQYSPRLLRNFMRDRGTQVVLSVFVGAFAYSTAGLYTVGTQRAGQQAFVPRLAVSGSLALALASVGVLIYFMHHLARSIQIDAIMSQIQRETREVIDDVYPHPARDPEPEARCPDPPAQAVVLPAAISGYVQAIQPASLVETATRQDLVVRLVRRVGDHVVEGTPLAWAWPRSPDQPPPTPALLAEAVADAVQVGFERPWSKTSCSGCAGWSTSPTRRCPRPSMTPTPPSRPSTISRSCCVSWPAGGWAIGCAATSRQPCGWRSHFQTLMSTCGVAPPRSAASGPLSRR
jgi:uncharacterized membrane protein